MSAGAGARACERAGVGAARARRRVSTDAHAAPAQTWETEDGRRILDGGPSAAPPKPSHLSPVRTRARPVCVCVPVSALLCATQRGRVMRGAPQ
jgi:hypothetical protein